jgi:hypothetical protein
MQLTLPVFVFPQGTAAGGWEFDGVPGIPEGRGAAVTLQERA